MTKKDYILIASVIREFFYAGIYNDTLKCNLKASRTLVDMFCKSLSAKNPKFKPETFRRYIVEGK